MVNPAIPKKINPDGLTDAIVAVQYTTARPPEASFGFFWQVFIDLGFSYTSVGQEANPMVPTLGWFKRDGILLQVTPEQLLFNGVSRPADSLRWQDGATGYIGWGKFQPTILEVLTSLIARDIVLAYKLVGIRYVNVLPWRKLNEQLLVELPKLPTTLQAIEQFQYRASTVTTDGYRVNLQLADNVHLPKEERTGALFDVEIWSLDSATDIEQLPQLLEQVHYKQKEVFFGLLTKEFLETLSPEY